MTFHQKNTRSVSGALDLMAAPSPAARHSGRFLEFQRWVLSDAQKQLPVHRLLVACLVAFDGAWTRSELLAVLRLAHTWLDLDGQVAASWIEDGRVQRRLLSHFTAVCWRSLPRTAFDWEHELLQLAIAYQQFSGRPDSADCLNRLLHLGKYWASLVLPPLLSAQLEGAVKLAAVPDAVWARRRGHVIGQVRPTFDICAKEICSEALYQAAADGKDQTAPWFLEKIKAAFTDCVGTGVNLSNERARRKLTENLAQLNNELVHAGVPGLLLFGWVQDLLVHGSARVSVPAIQTLRNYIHVAGPTLLRGMNAESDVMELEVNAWKAIYETAQVGCSEGQIRILNPALASFHRYLVRALDVDPIYGGFFAGDEASPTASVIWPHEIKAAHRILMCTPVEQRLQSQAVVIITLLANTSMRRAEICTLRLSSLWFYDDGVVVDVSPKRSHKSGKSNAARRRIVIHDGRACSTLRQWVTDRRAEAAVEDDLLFADPHRPKCLYQMGHTYALVMKALKEATGDPDVGWHTCRHTFASAHLAAALMNAQALSVSPLHRLQRSMGHASLITTLHTYCHNYEAPLRSHLDSAIAKVVTSQMLEKWTGEAACTLRQRKRRTGVEGVAYLSMIFSCATWNPGLEAEDPHQLAAADYAPGTGVRDRMTLSRTVKILSDIKRGMPIAGICSANSLSEEMLGCLCSVICSRGRDVLIDLEARVYEASKLLSALDFARLDQPRWQRMLNSLQSLSAEQGRTLATAWKKHGGPHGLSMVAPEEISPVLTILVKAGFQVSQMRLRVACQDHTGFPDREHRERQEYIGLTVADMFGAPVLAEQVRSRRGRPEAYLVPLTTACSSASAPPATVDAKSLLSVMFVYSIYAELEVSFE